MAFAYLIPALRIVLGLLFIVTSALKLPNLKGFATIVASYNILPRQLVRPAAYSLPLIELLVGFWILLGEQLVYAGIAGLLLMLMADFFMIKGFRQGKKMENCGCYGTAIRVPLTKKKIVENLIWTVLFVFLILGALELDKLGLI